MEQNFSALSARICKVETCAASASNVSGSARSWPSLEQVDGSTAAGTHGPGSSDDNRNTIRRLDTFSRLRMNMHEVPSYYSSLVNNITLEFLLRINSIWEKSNMPIYIKPIRIHCKTCGQSVRPVFETRAKCQDFVARYKDDGIPTKSTVHFATSKPISQSASPSHLKTRKSENDLRLCGKFWQQSSKNSLQKEMIQAPCSQFQGSQKRRGETSVQTCSTWKRTVV